MAGTLETLEMPSQSPMQMLGMAASRIAALKEELKGWQDEYNSMLQAILETNPVFEDSKFLKSTHVKGQMYKADGVGIIRSTRTSRKLQQGEFAEKYPKEFLMYANISLTDAEKVIGKDRILELCDLETNYVYKVIDLSVPGGEI